MYYSSCYSCGDDEVGGGLERLLGLSGLILRIVSSSCLKDQIRRIKFVMPFLGWIGRGLLSWMGSLLLFFKTVGRS